MQQTFAPDTSIHVCHVGSRDSGWSDNPLQVLGKDVFFTLFDADEKSVVTDQKTFQLKKKAKRVGNFRFIQACLADKASVREFHITQDPMTCGLLPFNEKLKDFMTTTITFNYSLSDAAKVVEKRKLRCTTIDILFEKAPDFLSLDAEGSEYDILMGARKSLLQVLGVKAETLFVEYRKGQKVFTDVHRFLTDRGFWFVSVDSIYPMHYKQSLDGARGVGFAFGGESLFVKDYRIILESSIEPLQKTQKLVKLAAIYLGLNLIDYAYQVLCAAQKSYPREFVQALSERRRYVRLCHDFYVAYKVRMGLAFPQQTYFASNKNFWNGVSVDKTLSNHNVVSSIRKIVGRKVRDKAWAVFKVASALAEKTHYRIAPYNTIEKILLRYHLDEQAKYQKRQRSKSLFGPKTFARRLGLT